MIKKAINKMLLVLKEQSFLLLYQQLLSQPSKHLLHFAHHPLFEDGHRPRPPQQRCSSSRSSPLNEVMPTCKEHSKNKLAKKLVKVAMFGCVVVFVLLVTVLLTWAILQPHKPRFVLQDTTLYAFNVSSNPLNLLTSTFQVTVSSRNRNSKIGIYYDKLNIYATYRDQQITLRTRLPKSYEGHKNVDVWSPFICGTQVPIAPYNAISLARDQAGGRVLVDIKIDGRLRWRVGSFTTTSYHIFVECRAMIPFGRSSSSRNTATEGILVENNGIQYQLMQSCTVTVAL